MIALFYMGKSYELSEEKRGLCAFEYDEVDCPDDRLDYGVCCRVEGRVEYFANFCLACKKVGIAYTRRDVKISFLKRRIAKIALKLIYEINDIGDINIQISCR